MSGRHRVAVLISPGVSPFEFGVACEVFGLDRSDLGVPWYRFELCAETAGPVPTQLGFSVEAPHGLRALRRADTIVLPPAQRRPTPAPVLAELRRAHARGARLLSLCTGVFALAEAGLLQGRRATTHWMHLGEVAARHPEIELEPDVLYVDEGDILTSAGTAGSIDLCLHVVRRDFGAEVANAVARRMVVPPHRDGGQAQYIDRPINDRPGGELFDATLRWAIEHLDQPITVQDLARRSAMSPRTFARRFTEVTGTTPHQWLTAQRVLHAQRLLEGSDLSIERIAEACGLGTAANLRLHFQRIVRTSPGRYRRTFQPRSA